MDRCRARFVPGSGYTDAQRRAEGADPLPPAGDQWLASRIDVAESTKTRNGLELEPIRPLLGARRVDEITPADVAAFVVTLDKDYSRGTIRKTLQTLQMLLDQAGVEPNPARDRQVRLPRGADEEINPPSAEHIEAVYRLLPSKHRLALLWLDWSGAPGFDRRAHAGWRQTPHNVRLRAATTKTRKALWVELHPVLADALEARLRTA